MNITRYLIQSVMSYKVRKQWKIKSIHLQNLYIIMNEARMKFPWHNCLCLMRNTKQLPLMQLWHLSHNCLSEKAKRQWKNQTKHLPILYVVMIEARMKFPLCGCQFFVLNCGNVAIDTSKVVIAIFHLKQSKDNVKARGYIYTNVIYNYQG